MLGFTVFIEEMYHSGNYCISVKIIVQHSPVY